jgi:hypothetical protein
MRENAEIVGFIGFVEKSAVPALFFFPEL